MSVFILRCSKIIINVHFPVTDKHPAVLQSAVKTFDRTLIIGLPHIGKSLPSVGKLQIFTVDSIDPESWDNNGPERPRIEMQERWYNYICEEFVPRLLEINREQGEDHTGCILTGGASMGGGHAVNFYLRRPDIFNGTIALSGLYSSGMFFGSYMDDLVYRNSPCDYMRNFPTTHPYMKLFEKADKFIMCCGQGAWEADLLASTKELQAILESKGIHPIVDIWGQDVSHDWYWWEKQWVYFLQMTLGDA